MYSHHVLLLQNNINIIGNTKIAKRNPIAIVTGCNISNILCQYKINIFDIMYGNNVCALMNKSNTKSNNIGNQKWKCNIILEMLDCLYGLSDCGLSIDEARQCLTYAATI